MVITTVVGVDEAEAVTVPASPSSDTQIGARVPHELAKVIVVLVIVDPVFILNALSFPMTKVQFASQVGLGPENIMCPFWSILKTGVFEPATDEVAMEKREVEVRPGSRVIDIIADTEFAAPIVRPAVVPALVLIVIKSGVEVAVPATVVVAYERMPPASLVTTWALPAPSEKPICAPVDEAMVS